MSSGLDACENDPQPIPEYSQGDASCAGELRNAQREQNKYEQSSPEHPWRWTAQTANQVIYGNTILTNNFCERCRKIVDILTRVLLCWDETPPMWAAARFPPGSSRSRYSPVLRHFLVSFGIIRLTMPTDCGFCTFSHAYSARPCKKREYLSGARLQSY